MSTPHALSSEQALTRLHELTALDVRTPGEYATGHLPGALNIPLDQISRGWSRTSGHIIRSIAAGESGCRTRASAARCRARVSPIPRGGPPLGRAARTPSRGRRGRSARTGGRTAAPQERT
ncbi:rhodanese-like domain-containing protein [Streptomyces virginiae]|uniref:rhodanese-like domain-containing protein n=1 Tax=unclassified Streptomyces TaxID=2593676 RepID=UPI002E2C3183|nr:rhodanese-like domain-containing protein [Streptomyces virginiae]